ncbi:hypothetical protein SLA2020_384840 [Shorea laevis]
MIMEKQSSFRAPRMEKQISFQGITIENQPSTRGVMEKQQSFKQPSSRGLIETQQSFKKPVLRVMEKQKSFRAVMERQLSFIGAGERRKNRDSPGKRGDSPLHLAARSGNQSSVREILQNWGGNDAKELLSKQNQEGETPLYVAAENGHAMVIEELVTHMDLETASIPAKNGFDAFHVAARQGHVDVLNELLQLSPNLVMTTDLSGTTALHTAAAQGHIEVVNLLLETDSNLAKIARNNGKTALHSAARMGRLEVVKSLLSKDPSTAFRPDRKGQTALHMAVKGQQEEMVLELLKPGPSILNLEDKKGNTALHIATKKGRIQMVGCLLLVKGIDVNAVNKAGESPLDIAEKFGNSEIVAILKEAKACNSKDHGKPTNPAKQLKQTVSDIKHDVQNQLQQTRQTGFRVHKIAKRLKKLHISGLNNAINSATVVAVLIATVAFAAIFTPPGQFVEEKTEGATLGQAHIANNAAFLVFIIFDSLALFISLAVVVVQTSVVVIEQKAKRQLVFVINKLMWLACLFISVAFISLTYVVVGKDSQWLAVFATLIGGSIMLTTIGAMFYFVIRHRIEETQLRNIRKAESCSRSFSMSVVSDSEFLNGEYKRLYAL